MTSKQFLDNVAKMLKCQSAWIDIIVPGLIEVLFIDETGHVRFKMGFWKHGRPMTSMFVECKCNGGDIDDEFYEWLDESIELHEQAICIVDMKENVVSFAKAHQCLESVMIELEMNCSDI